MEELENRVVLSTTTVSLDGGAILATALYLGKQNGVLAVNDSLSTGEASDFFSFSVQSQGNVVLTLGNLAANANLNLYNASGQLIDSSARGKTRSEIIRQELGRGTYVLSIDRGKSAGDTPYTLWLQADLNYETVNIGGTDYNLGLKRTDGTAAGISNDSETWVVIHGWLGSPDDVHPLAKAIAAANPRLQVLELDWSQVAADANAVNVVFDVPDVGAWAAAKLASWGIAGANINLVGHSYGGYMTDQIARNVNGGVNRIVALDPATAALGGIDFSGTDYKAHSRYSISFIGSDYGTVSAADTADEMINVDVGKRSSFVAHANVLFLFTNMTLQNNTKHHDNISPLFSLKQISAKSAYRPFANDALGDGYEAEIVGKGSNLSWLPGTLTYKNYATGRTVHITA